MSTSLSERALQTLERLLNSPDPKLSLRAAQVTLNLLEELPDGQVRVKPPRRRQLQVNRDLLSPEEKALLTAYRGLDSVPRLAVRRFVLSGDLRLVRAIYNQVFLGIRPRR